MKYDIEKTIYAGGKGYYVQIAEWPQRWHETKCPQFRTRKAAERWVERQEMLEALNTRNEEE